MFGKKTKFKFNFFFHLSVSSVVVFITPNKAYVKDEKVKLNCSVEGDPPPYVAWINVTDGSVLQNRTVNTSYIIPSVSSLHKGTYRCVTGNKCGKDSNETTITDVYCKSVINFRIQACICCSHTVFLSRVIIVNDRTSIASTHVPCHPS